MIFDTDVFIWFLRGQKKAATAINSVDKRLISIVTYMELLQGAYNKQEVRIIKSSLKDLQFQTLAITENIGHRASIYMEEYGLQVAMSMADALLAATAVENDQLLLTGNSKHYRQIKELRLKTFRI